MSDAGRMGGNRSIETAGLPSERRGGRINTTMEERRALASAATTIVDGRESCINGCGRLQVTATNPLCQACNTEKNKRKREEDEKSRARICAECDEEIVGRMTKGCCNPCYQRRHRKTGRVIDPATKLCTHLSGCDNKEYMGGLCRRHYRNPSSTSEYAAAASAATAPKVRRSTKARNGKKKAKKKKPVVVNKNAKTEGLAADYEDREEDSDYDDDNDDDDDWAEEH
jgi:hypothetical protein